MKNSFVKTLINNSLLISAINSIFFLNSTIANAQSTNVDFNSVITPIVFIGVTNTPSGSINITDNTFNSSEPAILSIQTITPLVLSVSEPMPVGHTDPDGTQYTTYLRYLGTEITNGQELIITQVGINNIEIDISVVRPGVYPPSNYTYRVTVTGTAQ